jgi:Leucine-rich repeat (LRR) protein
MVDYNNITVLKISNKELTELPDDIDKYTNLEKLNCSYNKITSLDNLPPTLKELNCRVNQITSLDNLPPKLEVLYCQDAGKNITLKINNIRHQYKNSECGVYCIYFLTSLLEGQSFENIIKNIVSDDRMNAKRKEFFAKV